MLLLKWARREGLVDRIQGEGLRFLIVLFEEAVDRGLQVGDRSKDAAL